MQLTLGRLLPSITTCRPRTKIGPSNKEALGRSAVVEAAEAVIAADSRAVAEALTAAVLRVEADAFTAALLREGSVHRGGVAYRGGAAAGRRGGYGYRGGGWHGGGYAWRCGYYRPNGAYWAIGGAIADGAAIGYLAASTATAYGTPPAPGYCWYYTDASRTNGFWDVCPQ
jgi:hypothetical protein